MSSGKVLGLTGGIACGKSTVATSFRALGAAVVDADQVSRDVTAKDTLGYERLLSRFGVGILDEQQNIDRTKLGALVFENKALRSELESIVHPLIADESMRQIQTACQTGAPLVLYEAALLIETKRHDAFRPLIVVWCSPEEQMKRLIHRDGLDQEAAKLRLNSQMPIVEKLGFADILIENNGSLATLSARVAAIWKELTQDD
ncbi:MAG: dephospho-CoA kinase [Bradymonadia bacterium]